VLAYDVLWFAGSDLAGNDGTVAALDSTALPSGAGEAPVRAAAEPYSESTAGPGAAPAVPAGAHSPAGAEARSVPSTPASPGVEPDWAALFAQLIAREASAQASSEVSVDSTAPDGELQALLAGHRLCGVVQSADGGVALIDGRLLRVGDTLPGTDLMLAAIEDDRVLLRTADRAAVVPLLLDPMGSGRSGGAP
jgi:hypothetical protein